MSINLILLILMVLATLWTVMARSILRATIALAATSAIITILIFRLNSPLAAVFELSVCTGLITVIFVSTISLTRPLTHKEAMEVSKKRHKRYWYLPVIVLIAGACLSVVKLPGGFRPFHATIVCDVRDIMWHFRQMDMFGQVVVIMSGAIGVVILFREKGKDER